MCCLAGRAPAVKSGHVNTCEAKKPPKLSQVRSSQVKSRQSSQVVGLRTREASILLTLQQVAKGHIDREPGKNCVARPPLTPRPVPLSGAAHTYHGTTVFPLNQCAYLHRSWLPAAKRSNKRSFNIRLSCTSPEMEANISTQGWFGQLPS